MPANWYSSFSTKLVSAITLLAAFVMLQGVVNVWIARVAEVRVERGRVAADLQAGFLDMARMLERLRAWSTLPPTAVDGSAASGEQLTGALLERVSRLDLLAARAEAMDDVEALSEHRARRDVIGILQPRLEQLRAAQRQMSSLADPGQWTLLSQDMRALIDGPGGVAAVLQARLEREERTLRDKREAADALFSWLRTIAVAATLSIAGLAALLAFVLARMLSKPLAQLKRGAEALQAGDLHHRIEIPSHDEFGRLAHGVNAMALELEARRQADMTTRERLENEVAQRTRSLHEALADLRESEARRRRLVAEISHELRTPTTAIRGEAEIALRARSNSVSDHRAALRRIVDASAQLGSVIEDLVTLARSDLDALPLTSATVNLRDVVIRAVEQARASAVLRDVLIDDLECMTDVSVIGDAHRLRQVVGILLDNAIRYSSKGDTVTLKLREELCDVAPASAVIEVSDQGIGIDPTDIGRVFDSQYRGANARLHRPDGAGLGLTIAHDLVTRHGGAMRITSPGRGVRVEVMLPAALAGEVVST